METWKVFLTVSGVVAAGILAYYLIKQIKTAGTQSDEEVLKQCFGEPVFSGVFSFQQAKEWLLNRKQMIADERKAIIMKVTPETLSSLGSQFRIQNDVDHYLVIAIVDTVTKNINDSVLIRYDSLDADLEDNLRNGNGVLVIGG